MTIRTLLENSAKTHPDAVALKFFKNERWQTCSYAQFLKNVHIIAQAYGTVLGAKPREENVALILPNNPEWVTSYLSCSGAGVGVVTVDPKLHDEEAHWIISNSQATIVTTDVAHLEMMRNILPNLPSVRSLVLIGAVKEEDLKQIGDVKVYSYEAFYEQFKETETSWYSQNVAKEDDIASILYTSGTTGKPKGAMLTHKNFIEDAKGSIEGFEADVDERDSFLVVLPLFHAFSFTANFVVALQMASALYFVRSLYTVAEDTRNLKPSVIMCVPLMAEKFYEKIEKKINSSKLAKLLIACGLKSLVQKKLTSSLGGNIRFMLVGGAPCPLHIINGFNKFGIKMIEGYGLTECAPIVSISGAQSGKVGTIGKKIPGIDVRIDNPNENGIGELQVKGPITMKGYWKNDEATAATFDGEWFMTGDLATIDDDGYITIRGRKKALIVNREGKNIYPEEVENYIAEDLFVSDCIVVGYTTGDLPGEKVGCIVCPNLEVLKEETNGNLPSWEDIEKITKDRVQARCHNMADYKRVRKVVISKTPLLRTSTQKIRRGEYKGTLDEK